MNQQLTFYNRQTGAVMAISLVMLLLLTLIGVTGTQVTSLEERMAGNSRDRNIAFQAAESGLRAGEDWISNQVLRPLSNSNPGVTQVWTLDSPASDPTAHLWWKERDYSWWTSNANQISSTINEVSTNPYYVVEQVEFKRDSLTMGMMSDSQGRVFYRVTAQGTGGTDTSRALVQSRYTKRY